MEVGTLGTITAGRMAGFAIVAFIWFWLSREVKIGNKWTSNVIFLAFVGILLFGLIYAGTRAPAVGVVAALAVYAVWNLFSGSLAKMGLVAVTLSLMGGVPVLISMMGGDGIGLSSGVFRGLDGGAVDRNAHARLMMWANSVEIIRNNPLGLGIGGYFNETGEDYPHNVLLEVGVELGLIPAFLLAFGLLFCMLFLFLRMVRGDGVSAFLLASLVYWAVAASFSFSLEYNEGLFFLLVLSVLWLLGGVREGYFNRMGSALRKTRITETDLFRAERKTGKKPGQS